MRVKLVHDAHWERAGETAANGKAFIDGECHDTQALADRFAETTTRQEFVSLLESTNGYFSVIHRTDEHVLAAVDHIRSWPLYYAIDDEVYLSDSAEWLHETIGYGEYDPEAIDEYLYLCYVSGRDTISAHVKQLRAGELIAVAPDEHTPELQRHFTWVHTGNETSTDLDAYEAQLTRGFDRLRDYADGRPLLVGVSSGFDSRLLGLMLHKLGFDDTILYTTQTAADHGDEMETAAALAADLGFEHISIQSTHADYHNLDDSDQRELLEDIGYLSEYPHINKLVLRTKLREAGIDVEEVVHVLGHQMLNLGEVLRERYRHQRSVTRDEFLEELWRVHYSNWIGLGDDGIESAVKSRLIDTLPSDVFESQQTVSMPEAVTGLGQWYWQERIPKFLLARREYEHLGFDMWYPLLDRELVAYYQGLSPAQIVGRDILKALVVELNEEIIGSTIARSEAKHEPSLSDKLWGATVDLVHQLPAGLTRRIRLAYHQHVDPPTHADDPRYGIISADAFEAMSFHSINHRTLLLLYLYDRGYFESPRLSEFDRAVGDKSIRRHTESVHATQS